MFNKDDINLLLEIRIYKNGVSAKRENNGSGLYVYKDGKIIFEKHYTSSAGAFRMVNHYTKKFFC